MSPLTSAVVIGRQCKKRNAYCVNQNGVAHFYLKLQIRECENGCFNEHRKGRWKAMSLTVRCWKMELSELELQDACVKMLCSARRGFWQSGWKTEFLGETGCVESLLAERIESKPPSRSCSSSLPLGDPCFRCSFTNGTWSKFCKLSSMLLTQSHSFMRPCGTGYFSKVNRSICVKGLENFTRKSIQFSFRNI